MLEESGRSGFAFEMMETSFFVPRETLIPTVSPGMALWRERLFASMSKNAVKASESPDPYQSGGGAWSAGGVMTCANRVTGSGTAAARANCARRQSARKASGGRALFV